MRRQVQRLRVIGGRWRGRKLRVLDSPGLRPTPSRNRETLFNWLSPRLPGACCLDLFAGSGALGIEALSRGAVQTVFVERAKPVAANLYKCLHTLEPKQTARWTLLQADARDCLYDSRIAQLGPFDIVFIDPPFAQANLWRSCLATLERANLLKSSSLISLGMPQEETLKIHANTPQGWRQLRSCKAGQSQITLLERMTHPDE